MEDNTICYQFKVKNPDAKSVFYQLRPFFIYFFVIGPPFWILLVVVQIFISPIISIAIMIGFGVFGVLLALHIHAKEILIQSDHLVIKHIIGKRIVKTDDLVSVRPLSEEQSIQFHKKLFVLHFNGRINDEVLIERKQRWDYVLTPDNKEEFIAKIKETWGEDIVKESQ